jgi:hypothetical protein
MKPRILHIVIFAVGLSIGAASTYALTRPSKLPGGDQEKLPTADPENASQSNLPSDSHEVASQKLTVKFQKELKDAVSTEDIDKVSKRIEAHNRLEDFIVKSREAQYTKFTLLSPTLVSVIALLSAAMSAIITTLVVKRGPHDTPASTNKDKA